MNLAGYLKDNDKNIKKMKMKQGDEVRQKGEE